MCGQATSRGRRCSLVLQSLWPLRFAWDCDMRRQQNSLSLALPQGLAGPSARLHAHDVAIAGALQELGQAFHVEAQADVAIAAVVVEAVRVQHHRHQTYVRKVHGLKAEARGTAVEVAVVDETSGMHMSLWLSRMEQRVCGTPNILSCNVLPSPSAGLRTSATQMNLSHFHTAGMDTAGAASNVMPSAAEAMDSVYTNCAILSAHWFMRSCLCTTISVLAFIVQAIWNYYHDVNQWITYYHFNCLTQSF